MHRLAAFEYCCSLLRLGQHRLQLNHGGYDGEYKVGDNGRRTRCGFKEGEHNNSISKTNLKTTIIESNQQPEKNKIIKSLQNHLKLLYA